MALPPSASSGARGARRCPRSSRTPASTTGSSASRCCASAPARWPRCAWPGPSSTAGARPRAGGVAAFAAAAALPGLATSTTTLSVALLVLGATSGAVDVAINAEGVRSEAATKRPVLSLAHGTFSACVVGGSLAAGALRSAGASAELVLGLVGAVVLTTAAALLRAPAAAGRRSTARWRLAAPPAPAAGDPPRAVCAGVLRRERVAELGGCAPGVRPRRLARRRRAGPRAVRRRRRPVAPGRPRARRPHHRADPCARGRGPGRGRHAAGRPRARDRTRARGHRGGGRGHLDLRPDPLLDRRPRRRRGPCGAPPSRS